MDAIGFLHSFIIYFTLPCSAIGLVIIVVVHKVGIIYFNTISSPLLVLPILVHVLPHLSLIQLAVAACLLSVHSYLILLLILRLFTIFIPFVPLMLLPIRFTFGNFMIFFEIFLILIGLLELIMETSWSG